MRFFAFFAGVCALCALSSAESRPGYYRYPALNGKTIVFTAEGDLWSVPTDGGVARRLTTSPGQETYASISPDGKTVAFIAEYEGPAEVYTMPVDGGLPTRQTWDGGGAAVAGWMPDGRLLYRTRRYSTLPDAQIVALDLKGGREVLELAQASEASFGADGKTVFFTRLPFQGSQTKRYQGRDCAEPVALDARFGGRTADEGLRGYVEDPHVLEGPFVFPERPRRSHERVVDDPRGQGSEAAYAAQGL